jgi:polar amino acid transport system substrate-binding protein
MKALTRVLQVALLVLLVCGMASLVAAAGVQQELVEQSMIEQVSKRGTLRVGLDTFVPWAMKDKTGKLIGFEVDVATRLAKDTGVEVEFIPTQWAGIVPALLTGKFDIIIGGMTIRPDRALKVNFSIPYDYSGQTICANKALAAGFKKPEDFNRPEVTIGVRLGTTSLVAVRRVMPKATVRQFAQEPELYQELLNGNLHAVVASLPTPAYQALKYPDKLFAITEPFSKELIGFAVRKGDPDSLNYLNSWIRTVDAEGWLHERHNYWFNTKEWEQLLK